MLTPEDVSNKRFTPVRLREGYDMGEVDQFLDEVEASLEQLRTENNELRAKLAAAQSGALPAVEEAESVAPAAEPAPVETAPATGVQEIKVTTVADASSAAARLLELATNNADQLVDGAKEEADKIIGAARTKAERLEAETKVKADRLESDARTRAAMLDSEVAAKRKEIFAELEVERDQLNAEIESLRVFEREYRSRLKSYFTQQLETLEVENQAGEEPLATEHSPKRLRSILGEEDEN